MNPTSKPKELAESTRSSAFEVALGLALAGAVCGLVALSQSASADSAFIDASVSKAPVRSAAEQAPALPTAADSIEVALTLRQRTASNLLLDEGR